MPFSSQQTRGRIHAYPARARQIGFAPGVQVGEISARTRRAIQWLFVSHQLDEIAGDEARRNAQMAQQLHQQPSAVAAGTGLFFQRLFAALHAGFEPNQVGHRMLHPPIQQHQKVSRGDSGRNLGPERLQPTLKARSAWLGFEERCQLGSELLGVDERVMLGPFLHEEVEGIDDRHVGQEIDRDVDLPGRFGEGQAGDEVPIGILLPMNEMRLGKNLQRIASHRCAGVGGGPQPDFMRRGDHGPVKDVMGTMVQRNANGHGGEAQCSRPYGDGVDSGGVSLSQSGLGREANTPRSPSLQRLLIWEK